MVLHPAGCGRVGHRRHTNPNKKGGVGKPRAVTARKVSHPPFFGVVCGAPGARGCPRRPRRPATTMIAGSVPRRSVDRPWTHPNGDHPEAHAPATPETRHHRPPPCKQSGFRCIHRTESHIRFTKRPAGLARDLGRHAQPRTRASRWARPADLPACGDLRGCPAAARSRAQISCRAPSPRSAS
jgi:hypothetical protein